MASVHRARRALRTRWSAGERVVGTFVKLPGSEVVELAAGAGLDLIVLDLEHSTLTEGDAITAVRTADLLGLPALVRLPSADGGLITRLLENGAAGIQLSGLDAAATTRALRAFVTCGPGGRRSVSLAHRVAGFGATDLTAYLAAEAADPPLVVGQIEGPLCDPIVEVLTGLDAVVVGTTDLAVSRGLAPGDPALAEEVGAVLAAARRLGVPAGGWVPSVDRAAGLGLAEADYLLVGSDLQFLGGALRAAAVVGEDT